MSFNNGLSKMCERITNDVEPGLNLLERLLHTDFATMKLWPLQSPFSSFQAIYLILLKSDKYGKVE